MISDAFMAKMFDRIAPRYDFLNRLLSFRRDIYWRRKLVAYLPKKEKLHVVDVATGTGDLAISMCRHAPNVWRVAGVDVSSHMLSLAHIKLEDAKLLQKIHLYGGTASALNFKDETFDAATVAFGVRNFADLDASLKEMARVLKARGRLLVLEFSLPQNALVRFFYMLYFRHILPVVGGWFSSDRAAYQYLNNSVEMFQQKVNIAERMSQNGFEMVALKPMTFGVATLYVGEKR